MITAVVEYVQDNTWAAVLLFLVCGLVANLGSSMDWVSYAEECRERNERDQ